MKSPFLISIVGSFLFLSASTCSADWVFDHLEINGKSVKKDITLLSNHDTPQTFDNMTQTTVTETSWSQGQQQTKTTIDGVEQSLSQSSANSGIDSARVGWGEGRYFGDNSPVSAGAIPQKASFSYTVRAVFKWNRRSITNPTTWEQTPDPSDNPPEKCWFFEQAAIGGGESTRQWDWNWLPYFQANGYKGSEYSFRVNHPFDKQYTETTPFSYGSSYGANFFLGEGQVTLTEEKQGDFAIGPDRTFSSEVSLHTYLLNHLDRRSDGYVSWSYVAEPVKFQILSRLKGDHDPNDLITDFVGENSYYSATSIAAGHKETDINEHKADIVIQVLHPTGWGYWGNVGNVKMPRLPELKVTDKEGVEQHAALLPPETEFDGKLKEGRAAIAILLSSDKIRNVSVSPKNAVGSGTHINQNWGQVEWRMGENGEKDWNPDFFSAMQDSTAWLWTKVLFHDDYENSSKDIALTKHSMKFVVTRLQVREIDEAGKPVERVYTIVPIEPYSTEIDGVNVTPEIVLVSEIDVSKYIEFSPAAIEDGGNGTYKTEMKILKNPAQTLRHFIVELEDQGAFHFSNY